MLEATFQASYLPRGSKYPMFHWSPNPLRVRYVGPETSDIGYLDPLALGPVSPHWGLHLERRGRNPAYTNCLGLHIAHNRSYSYIYTFKPQTQAPGQKQKVDTPQSSITYTIGLVEYRTGGFYFLDLPGGLYWQTWEPLGYGTMTLVLSCQRLARCAQRCGCLRAPKPQEVLISTDKDRDT